MAKLPSSQEVPYRRYIGLRKDKYYWDMTTSAAPCPGPTGAAATLFMTAISTLTRRTCDFDKDDIYPKDPVLFHEYDFVIVGASAPGLIAANRLTEYKKNWKILLLECGGNPPYTSDVPYLADSLKTTDSAWPYATDGKGNYCLGMKNHQCFLTKGKSLGGSSILDSISYFRGHPKDYDKWAWAGNHGWSYEELVFYFNRIEGFEKGPGLLKLEKLDGGESSGKLPLLSPLVYAAKELGHRATLHPEVITNSGYFSTYGTITNGTRCNAAKAYLRPCINRENLHVLKDALATKILLDDCRGVTGVEYLKNGTKYTVKVNKEVIVSSGAINSAVLLMLSGIGPWDHLTRLGIKNCVNLPVGYNFQDHIFFPGVVASINRLTCPPPDLIKELVEAVAKYLMERKGILAGCGYSQYTGFVNTGISKDYTYPDIQIKFYYFLHGDIQAVERFTSGLNYNEAIISKYKSLVKEADLLVIAPTLMHPKSRGRVSLRSSNPKDPPVITANYFDYQIDMTSMLNGVAEAVNLLRTYSLNAAAKIEPRLMVENCIANYNKTAPPHLSYIDDSHLFTTEYWECAIRHMATSTNNPVGTCEMGPCAVVDKRLRVYGIDGLRVIDESIMPTITTGSTSGAKYLIGEYGAAMTIEDWKH